MIKWGDYIKKISVNSMDNIMVFTAIGISIAGFIITVIGAFLNGLAMFNNSEDLSEGFGLILIGDSISFFGVIIIVITFVLYVFRSYWVKEKELES